MVDSDTDSVDTTAAVVFGPLINRKKVQENKNGGSGSGMIQVIKLEGRQSIERQFYDNVDNKTALT